jgi:hypothetical protein
MCDKAVQRITFLIRKKPKNPNGFNLPTNW